MISVNSFKMDPSHPIKDIACKQSDNKQYIIFIKEKKLFIYRTPERCIVPPMSPNQEPPDSTLPYCDEGPMRRIQFTLSHLPFTMKIMCCHHLHSHKFPHHSQFVSCFLTKLIISSQLITKLLLICRHLILPGYVHFLNTANKKHFTEYWHVSLHLLAFSVDCRQFTGQTDNRLGIEQQVTL